MKPRNMRPFVLLAAATALISSGERVAVGQQSDIAPVRVPAEGPGPDDSKSELLPDGTKVIKAPHASFVWKPQPQRNRIAGQVYDVDFSGEAILIVPAHSSQWRLVGPNGLGVGHFLYEGRYAVRATPEGFLVTVESGTAALERDNHGIIQVIRAGQTGIAVPDKERVQRVFFKKQ